VAEKKTKRVLFSVNYYEQGVVKYAAGSHYPVTEETARRIIAGDAEEVEVTMAPDVADAQAEAAKAAEAEAKAAEQITLDRGTAA
jgi:hypothetical protein